MKVLKTVGLAFAALLMVGIFLANSYKDLIDPYYWDGPIIEEARSNGYELFQRHKGGDLIFPWTFFYPYTTHLAFTNPKTIKSFRQFIAADIAWARREQGGKIDKSRSITLFDCREKVFTTLMDGDGKSFEHRIFRADGGPMMKWWMAMNDQMAAYFCKQ